VDNQAIPHSDPKALTDLCRIKMPYGKYKGRLICDLPTYYLEWFSSKGFPEGRLGMLLETMFVIKTNQLDYLLIPIRRMMKD
jgi:uncharacterized protein (DUF3820 family)